MYFGRPSSTSRRRSALLLRLARDDGRYVGSGNDTGVHKPRWVYIGSCQVSCGAEPARVCGDAEIVVVILEMVRR